MYTIYLMYYGRARLIVASKISKEELEKAFREKGFVRFKHYIKYSPLVSEVKIRTLGVEDAYHTE